MNSHTKIFLFNTLDMWWLKIWNMLKLLVPYYQQSEWILLKVPTNDSKEKIKKYEELWKIRDLIRSMTKNSVDYDEKYMKIKFNSDDQLPLNKMIEIINNQNVILW